MATCGSLRSLFEAPLPENPTLIDSLSSWNHHNKPMKPMEVSSFAEIFGELYFHEKESDSKDVQLCENPPSDSLFGLPEDRYKCDPKGHGGFSSKSFESLQFCTERLGSESSDDVDDLMDSGDDWRTYGNGKGEIGRRQLMYSGANGYSRRSCWDVRSSKSQREFPPPISSIGKSGKPCVRLKSYREGGRFVLKEIRIPTQELLRASREDGRLKLQFVHPDEYIAKEEEEEDDDETGGETKEEDDDEEKVSEGENHQ